MESTTLQFPEDRILRVGLFDRCWEGQESITRFQVPPKNWQWIRGCDDPTKVDVVVASLGSHGIVSTSKHPRKVALFQETVEAHPVCGSQADFNLVLTNATGFSSSPGFSLIVSNLSGTKIGSTKYQYYTLIGTQLSQDYFEFRPESQTRKSVSALFSGLAWLSGHKLRHKVTNAFKDRIDIYGTIRPDTLSKGSWIRPDHAYHGYKFNIAIENSNYPWWHTEKIFNCFAAKVIPIYWGAGGDYSRLREWGFDVSGVITWNGDLDELASILDDIDKMGETMYNNRLTAIETNYTRAWELNPGEVYLREVLVKEFGQGIIEVD